MQIQQRGRLSSSVPCIHSSKAIQRVADAESGGISQIGCLRDGFRDRQHLYAPSRCLGTHRIDLCLVLHDRRAGRIDRRLRFGRFARHHRTHRLVARMSIKAPLCPTTPPPLAIYLVVAVPDGGAGRLVGVPVVAELAKSTATRNVGEAHLVGLLLRRRGLPLLFRRVPEDAVSSSACSTIATLWHLRFGSLALAHRSAAVRQCCMLNPVTACRLAVLSGS
mmetsp:Transcript_5246/g.14489  ORF Transcript_5246/g.14489 Transcript_5246/m.14489 type:complete len:221 (+) Transcript_5246:2149-2811(+)